MSFRKWVLFILSTAIIISVVLAPPHIISVFKDSAEKSESINLPVLMYHSIIPDSSKSGKYVITPQKFEEDLLYLEQKGYTTISAKQLIRYVYANGELPEKPVIITFDDGMYNNMEYAVPILEKHGACAIFSVVGSYTDEYTESNIVNPTYSYLRWADIASLSERGCVEFGNHSYDFHSISPKRYGIQKNKSEDSLEYINVFYQDTQKMQSEFFSHCNYRPIIYTYPFGSYSKESSRVLEKMEFLISFSCSEGINKITRDGDCLFMLKRYNRDGRPSTWQFFSKLKI